MKNIFKLIAFVLFLPVFAFAQAATTVIADKPIIQGATGIQLVVTGTGEIRMVTSADSTAKGFVINSSTGNLESVGGAGVGSISAGATASGNLIFTGTDPNTAILTNSSAKRLLFYGGDALNNTHGNIAVNGSAFSGAAGDIAIAAGSVTNGDVTIAAPHSTGVINFATNGFANTRFSIDATGALVQNATNGGDIVFAGITTNSIRQGTADGSDNSFVNLAGGGDCVFGGTRGACFSASGNENAGTAEIVGGDAASANIGIRLNGSGAALQIKNSANAILWSIAQSTGNISQDPTNGGNIVLTRGSTAVAQTRVDNITAAGAVQADATALTGVVNVVATTAVGTGVRLWEAPVGSFVSIHNAGANALLVYPPTSGQINGYAVNAGASVASGSHAMCFKRAASGGNSWICFESPNI